MDSGILLIIIVVLAILAYLGIVFILPRYTFNRKKYALQRGGAKRLEIKWRVDNKKVFINLDSNEIGMIEFSKGEQLQGKSITLLDGSILTLKLNLDTESKRVVFAPDLTLNGKPMPGSINDPGYKLDTAVKNFYWVGVLNILSGFFVYFIPEVTGFAWIYLLAGITSLLVGFYLKRLSRIALKVGIALTFLGGLVSLFVLLVDLSSKTGGTIFKGLFELFKTYLLIDGLQKGYKAIDYLENEKKEMEQIRETKKEKIEPVKSSVTKKTLRKPEKKTSKKTKVVKSNVRPTQRKN